jgi:tetratricopeptide (TPR) repeat protein
MSRRILVVTVHGIRTFGQWQERLEEVTNASAVARDDEVVFKHKHYGYFSVLSFVNPLARQAEAERFSLELAALLSDHPERSFDRVCLVGHSFGTHIIAQALRHLPSDIATKIDTVIFGGSVLSTHYPWNELLGTRIIRLVNDCGTRDGILPINAMLPLGSGVSGRNGFEGVMDDNYCNRYFSFGHSGYFYRSPKRPEGGDDNWFLTRYWAPLLLGHNPVENADERNSGPLSGLLVSLVARTERFKWVLPAIFQGLLIALVLFIYSLYVTAQSNFDVAKKGADDLAFNLADRVPALQNRRSQALREILVSAQSLIDPLAVAEPADLSVRRTRFLVLARLVKAHLDLGETSSARTAAEECIRVMPSVAFDKGEVLVCREGAGDARLVTGDVTGAITAYRDALVVATELVDLGSKEFDQFVQDAADYGLHVRFVDRRLKQAIEPQLGDQWTIIIKSGDASLRAGDRTAGLDAYQKVLDAAGDADLNNGRYYQALAYQRIGAAKFSAHDSIGALQQFQNSLESAREAREIEGQDRGNTDPATQEVMASALEGEGEAQAAMQQWSQAITSYQASLVLWQQLVATDESNAVTLLRLSKNYISVGDCQRELNADSIASYVKSLQISTVLASNTQNVSAREVMHTAFDRIDDVEDLVGKNLIQGSLVDTLRSIIKLDPENTVWKIDLATALYVLNTLSPSPLNEQLREALVLAEQVKASGKLPPNRNKLLQNLRGVFQDVKAPSNSIENNSRQ